MNRINPEIDSTMFENMSEKQLLQIGNFLFSYFSHDDFNRKIRKVFIIEQFSNKELCSLYIKQYFDSPIAF